jgi:hypothetical protein
VRYAYAKTGAGSLIPPDTDIFMEFELRGVGKTLLPEERMDEEDL